MERIPVENTTAMPMYVAGCMIPPGETRHFDKSQVPSHFWPQDTTTPETTEETNPLAEILKGNVGTVVAALADMSTADIEKLGELEQAGKKRSGVLNAIAEITLERAGNPKKAANPAIATLPVLEDDALLALQAEETAKGDQADADLLAAIATEVKARSIATIPTLTDEKLLALTASETVKGDQADAELLAAIAAEIENRKK